VVKHLPSLYKVLGSIPSTAKKQNENRKKHLQGTMSKFISNIKMPMKIWEHFMNCNKRISLMYKQHKSIRNILTIEKG
jgi:hypothetical protein